MTILESKVGNIKSLIGKNHFNLNFLWIADYYRWLEDPDSVKTADFVQPQNNLTRLPESKGPYKRFGNAWKHFWTTPNMEFRKNMVITISILPNGTAESGVKILTFLANFNFCL